MVIPIFFKNIKSVRRDVFAPGQLHPASHTETLSRRGGGEEEEGSGGGEKEEEAGSGGGEKEEKESELSGGGEDSEEEEEAGKTYEKVFCKYDSLMSLSLSASIPS